MYDPPNGGKEKPKRDSGSQYGYEPTSGDPYRERGGCLTAFLIFAIAANVFMLFAICIQYSEITSNSWRYQDPGTARGILMLAWVVQAAILASAVALWKWKTLGYYGLMAGYLVGMALNLCTGNVFYAIGGGIGLVILYSLVNPKLDMLD